MTPKDWSTAVTVMLLTLGGLLAAMLPRVRRLPVSFAMGECLILVFCTAVGMLVDVEQLASTSAFLILYVAATNVGAVALHVALARLLDVDADTLIVSSVCNICSPPFVPLACRATQNYELMAPGVVAGLLGYALGNYLGIATVEVW